MNERRRFRRSSPDAPQGVIPVLAVLAALVVVVVVAGVGFFGSDSAPETRPADRSRVPPDANHRGGPSSVVPTTVLIRGSVVTTLFVTTTTPITTTTSTTSTLPAEPSLDAGSAEVGFAPGQRSVSFQVTTTDPDGLDFDVTGVPEGMSASPTSATVTVASPVTVTLRITDPTRARSGTIVLVGSDGSRVPVRVTVADTSVQITAVSFDPDPPVCGTTTQLRVTVAGDAVRSVTATANGSPVALTESGGDTWSGRLPDGRPGTSLAVTVRATGSDGSTATRDASSRYVDGPSCKH